MRTNDFKKELPHYSAFRSIRLSFPTAFTPDIIKKAMELLNNMYIGGYHYKKAGVFLTRITSQEILQHDLFENSLLRRILHRYGSAIQWMPSMRCMAGIPYFPCAGNTKRLEDEAVTIIQEVYNKMERNTHYKINGSGTFQMKGIYEICESDVVKQFLRDTISVLSLFGEA